MAEPATTPEAATEPSTFEQPLNERMRTFLRLDFLYTQALYHNEKGPPWGSRAAVGSLLDILAILTRGDMRTDVLKELERHLAQLNEFQNRAGIDAARLRALMSNLVRLRTELTGVGGSWLAPLKDSAFLAAIKHRSAIPGGTCEFDLPDYFFWLNQPAENRIEAFGRWLTLLRPLCDAVSELLWLTRQNGRAERRNRSGGVFNDHLRPRDPLPAAAHNLAARSRVVPGDQRQSLPLQHALPEMARHRATLDPVRCGCALHADLLHLKHAHAAQLSDLPAADRVVGRIPLSAVLQ